MNWIGGRRQPRRRRALVPNVRKRRIERESEGGVNKDIDSGSQFSGFLHLEHALWDANGSGEEMSFRDDGVGELEFIGRVGGGGGGGEYHQNKNERRDESASANAHANAVRQTRTEKQRDERIGASQRQHERDRHHRQGTSQRVEQKQQHRQQQKSLHSFASTAPVAARLARMRGGGHNSGRSTVDSDSPVIAGEHVQACSASEQRALRQRQDHRRGDGRKEGINVAICDGVYDHARGSKAYADR